MKKYMKKILLEEDNETIIMGLKYSLEQEEFQVISAKTAKESKEKLDNKSIDIVLLDVSLLSLAVFADIT